MRTWLRMLRTELPVLRDLPDLSRPPLPRVGLRVGASARGWMLRLAAMVAVSALTGIAVQRTGMAPATWAFVLVPALVMALWPSQVVAHAAVIVSGILIAFDPHGPFDPVVFALIPLAYAAVRLTWWAERVAPAARVEIAALAVGVGRGCAFVGATLALGGAVFWIAGRPSAALVAIGGLGLVALSWLLFAARATRTR